MFPQDTKINVGNNTIDVARVTRIIPNRDGDKVLSYTLVKDGVHDDTDSMGHPLKGAAVGDYDKEANKSATGGHVGNRDSFTRDELKTFFVVYDELNNTNYVNDPLGEFSRESEGRSDRATDAPPPQV